jgi:hypothetical protein
VAQGVGPDFKPQYCKKKKKKAKDLKKYFTIVKLSTNRKKYSTSLVISNYKKILNYHYKSTKKQKLKRQKF